MAGWLSRRLSRDGYAQIRVARGIVSWGSMDNKAAGELQLWCRERHNNYYLYVSNTAGDERVVCKVKLLMFLLFTSKSALTKSKSY